MKDDDVELMTATHVEPPSWFGYFDRQGRDGRARFFVRAEPGTLVLDGEKMFVSSSSAPPDPSSLYATTTETAQAGCGCTAQRAIRCLVSEAGELISRQAWFGELCPV